LWCSAVSKRQQALGAIPLKVRFEGVDGDSPQARMLYEQMQGELGQFYHAARQAVDIPEAPGGARIKQLAGGGQLRYTNNQGLESLDVRLTPQQIAAVQQRTPRQPDKHDVVLAIDVLFENELYLAGDVTSYTEVEVAPADPGTPGDPFPPESAWTFLFASADPVFSPSSPAVAGGADANGTYLTASKYYRANGSLAGYIGPYLTSVAGTALLSPVNILGPSVSIDPFTLVYGAPVWTGSATLIRVEFGWTVPGAALPVPPTDADIRKYYERNTYKYFDVLNVVGVQVGALDDGGYSARSAGPRVEDDRLKALSGRTTDQTVDRALTVASPKTNIVGQCFAARPRDTADPTTEIDVYVATCNISKINAYPDGEGSTLDVDDPTFNYTPHQPVRWTLRLREYIDEAPVAIGVTTVTEQETQLYYAPDVFVPDEIGGHFEPGHDVPPSLFDPPVVAAATRSATWAFAARPDWVDTGDGADPTAPSSTPNPALGNQLGEASGIKVVTGPTPLLRELLDSASWEQLVTAMTKIATIKWTAPLSGGIGSATIEIA